MGHQKVRWALTHATDCQLFGKFDRDQPSMTWLDATMLDVSHGDVTSLMDLHVDTEYDQSCWEREVTRPHQRITCSHCTANQNVTNQSNQSNALNVPIRSALTRSVSCLVSALRKKKLELDKDKEVREGTKTRETKADHISSQIISQ